MSAQMPPEARFLSVVGGGPKPAPAKPTIELPTNPLELMKLGLAAAEGAEEGIDDQHEALGMRFLQKHFPEAVTEPVRLHVEAKRYLCTAEEGYASQLSQPSIISLKLQGGPMSAEEAVAFERLPHSGAAVQLRKYDDAAKVPGLATPGIQTFLPYLEQCLAR
jgi:predicted HD phosphohydrolase